MEFFPAKTRRRGHGGIAPHATATHRRWISNYIVEQRNMSPLRRLFEVPPEPRSVGAIVLWWEFRRPAYWAFLVAVGLGGGALLAFAMRNPPPGDEGFEPFLIITLGVFGSNICYTGGWIAEVIARTIWREKVTFFGPVAFGLGLIFSAAVCLIVPLIFALFSILM
jgi:hypothetical protein